MEGRALVAVFLCLAVTVLLPAVGATDAALSGSVENVTNASSEPVEVMVSFEPSREASTPEGLREAANLSQRGLLRHARSHEGVRVLERHWISNSVLVELSPEHGYESLTSIRGVESVTSNLEVEVADADRTGASETRNRTGTQSVTTLSDHEYGLEQIGAPRVWSDYGTRGEGVKVAVLDTGVNVSHPDIELRTTDGSDPTYPGGWAEFADDGSRVPDSEPYDSEGHGTLVSGLVAGEETGVAPETELMHGLVAQGNTGTASQVLSGMEWAVENDADVITISLGTSTDEIWQEAVSNANEMGVIVVGAIGNGGEGTSASPGNVYDTVSVGATDPNLDVPTFSGGETIDTDAEWGDSALEDWPQEYIVPDVVAAGVNVNSTSAQGGYGTSSGTSFSAPHVAGATALITSAVGDVGTRELTNAYRLTAYGTDSEDPDTRYGYGVADAYAATDFLSDDATVSGEVVNSSGAPIRDAEVEVDGLTVGTDGAGYTVPLAEGSWRLTASAPGYDETVETVTLSEGEDVSMDLVLSDGDPTDPPEEQPAFFDVGALNVSTPVVEGDALGVEAVVTNTGDEAGTRTVAAELPGAGNGSSSVALGGGSSTTERFGIPTEGGDAGSYTLTVDSGDDSASVGVVVERAPSTVARDCSGVSYEGDGTASSPYEVSNPDQLQCTVEKDLGATYRLVSDVDATATAGWNDGAGFEPIGRGEPFTGVLNGDGHSVEGLALDRPGEERVGLFAELDGEASVNDLALVNATVTGNGTTAPLVAVNNGTVERSSATGEATSPHETAGLVAVNRGEVVDSYATADVEGSREAGGLVAVNEGTVRTSYAAGTVTGFVPSSLGGLVGGGGGTVEDSYWDVTASGRRSSSGGTGLRTEEMTGAGAAENMTGFDFADTWRTVTEPGSYPALGGRSLGAQNPFVDEGRPLPVEDAADVLFSWNRNGVVNGAEYTTDEMSDYLFEWNGAN